MMHTALKYAATMSLVSTAIATPLVLVRGSDIAGASVVQVPVSKTIGPGPLGTTPDELIAAGPTRKKCVELPKLALTNGAFPVAAGVDTFEAQTGTSVSCLTEYLNGAPTWSQWANPYITAPYEGVTTWVAAAPQSRQLVLEVDLIPDSLEDQSDPLAWEQSCADGQFNAYAQQLGTNLVAAGLQNSVLRLGAEMNGSWEADFIGTTTVEQNLWATCFANEVTGLREATGEHFLIDWNPAACVGSTPYANYYPGDAYVDILGLDFYDQSCETPNSAVSWTQLANLPAGLISFEAFATTHAKPMSLPEWGLAKDPAGDDPAYINGVGSTFAAKDFAFEGYFDSGAGDSMPLSAATPLSLAAFRRWF
ncbi:MAG TPA: glycosyl hydrolase [Acidimicrobiales bacterium]|nr:glycosyl hydrolase [Acidimicrobiales bacterium]